jgi:hypothetical protein
MKDKPIPAKILLTLLDKKANGENFIGLSGTLYRQNLIYSEPRELRQNGNILELTIIFQDTYSYKNWTKNNQIIEYWANTFDKHLSEKPKTLKEKDIIIEVDNVTNCNCEKSNFLILQGRSLQFTDELICNNCFGQIPFSRIPLEINIEDWQRHHQRIYFNWLDSGIFEKEAYKELTNYKKGKLNLAGEKIRQQLSNHFKIPVYLSYFVEQPNDNHPCLVCGQQGIKSGLKKPNRICKTCNTIFGYEYTE